MPMLGFSCGVTLAASRVMGALFRAGWKGFLFPYSKGQRGGDPKYRADRGGKNQPWGLRDLSRILSEPLLVSDPQRCSPKVPFWGPPDKGAGRAHPAPSTARCIAVGRGAARRRGCANKEPPWLPAASIRAAPATPGLKDGGISSASSSLRTTPPPLPFSGIGGAQLRAGLLGCHIHLRA